MPTLLRRIRDLLSRDQLDRELDEEMGLHLELLVTRFRNEGLDEAEARRRARIAFGPAQSLREEARDARGLRLLEEFGRDLRYGLRMLGKAPGFATAAVLTLALGIGATTAIFSVVNGVLLKPLPFEDPDELVGVWTRTLTRLAWSPYNGRLTGPQDFTYRAENRVFEDIGIFNNSSTEVTVTGTGLGEPELVRYVQVTAGLLPLLRVQPVIGRRFTEEDDSPGAPWTIMLSHEFWQRQGADPAVVGRTLGLTRDLQAEIIGVLPPEFALSKGQDASLYIPFQLAGQPGVGLPLYSAIARLSPGATLEQAGADLERMLPMWVEQSPNAPSLASLEETQWSAYARPLKLDYIGDIGSVLWLFLGAAGIVLVIACANVANLFLVRSEGRQQEVAVRTALGAGRGQIARQFLLESLVLGLMGGLAGLGLAVGGVRLLIWMGPENLPRLSEIAVDRPVLAFTLGVSVLAGLLFGMFPAFRTGGLDLVSSLKEGGRGGSAGTERHRARHALVVAQIALALVLLAGSGLMIRSFQALRNVDPGFSNPEEVLTFRVFIPGSDIEDHAEVVLAYEDMWRRLQAIPGVTSVGASTSLTMDGAGESPGLIRVEDFPRQTPVTQNQWITGGYFEAM